MRSAAPLAVLLVVGSAIATAQAQPPPSAALLATTASRGVGPELPEAFDRALRSELGGLDAVQLHGSVALNLEDVQLALGCEGETRACLGGVAREIGVRQLLLPNLDRVGSELLLSVALFDAQGDGAPRRVSRRASGDEAAAALLDEVRGLLRDVLGLEPASAEAVAETVPETSASPLTEAPPPSSGPDAGRLGAASALLGAGLIGVGIGAGFGVAALDSQAAYEAQGTDTVADAEEAGSQLRAGRDQALLANVSMIAGGVLAAAGVAWLIAEVVLGAAPASDGARVAPYVGPERAGVELRGAF